MQATLARTSRVLVIDDDASMTRMIAMSLRMQGFAVSTACNGADGLDRVKSDVPDVIVLDLAMPVMDGRTFYQQLRARGDETPVLVLSAYGARLAARELHAQDFMPKPFHPDELTEKVQRLVDARDGAA